MRREPNERAKVTVRLYVENGVNSVAIRYDWWSEKPSTQEETDEMLVPAARHLGYSEEAISAVLRKRAHAPGG